MKKSQLKKIVKEEIKRIAEDVGGNSKFTTGERVIIKVGRAKKHGAIHRVGKDMILIHLDDGSVRQSFPKDVIREDVGGNWKTSTEKFDDGSTQTSTQTKGGFGRVTTGPKAMEQPKGRPPDLNHPGPADKIILAYVKSMGLKKALEHFKKHPRGPHKNAWPLFYKRLKKYANIFGKVR